MSRVTVELPAATRAFLTSPHTAAFTTLRPDGTPHALPVIAAGGIATAAGVTAALRAGAVAAMVGTVLLRTQESGPDRGSGRCCGLWPPPADAWTNRRGATAGASIPLRQSARSGPLRD